MGKLPITVQPGERSTELVRLPSLNGKDGLPVEVIEVARDAIRHGRTVKVATLPWESLSAVMTITGIIGGFIAMIALFEGAFAFGILVLLIAVVLMTMGSLAAKSITPNRLRGRPVAGKDRISTALWQQALAEVDAGTRAETQLPDIHTALIAVANAEDKVNRLTARNKYRLDQSTVEVARQELSTVIAAARDLMVCPLRRSKPPRRICSIGGPKPPTSPSRSRPIPTTCARQAAEASAWSRALPQGPIQPRGRTVQQRLVLRLG